MRKQRIKFEMTIFNVLHHSCDSPLTIYNIDHFTDFALTGGEGYPVYLPSVLEQ